MRFTIEGAEESTGRDRVITVEADDESQAEQRARGQGLVVSNVHASSVQELGRPGAAGVSSELQVEPAPAAAAPAAAPAPPAMRGNGARTAPVVQKSAASAPPALEPSPSLRYGTRPARPVSRPIPDYAGLNLGAAILRIFAAVYYLQAAVGIGLAVYALLVRPVTIGTSQLEAPVLAVLSVGGAMLGGLLQAASTACEALRDLARNSFAKT